MKKKRIMTNLEATFYQQVRAVGLPEPEKEFRFHHIRKFRFDFAWVDFKVAVEVDGGTWSGGRHVKGTGFHNDCIKMNLAAVEGWLVLRGDNKMVKSGELLKSLEAVMFRHGVKSKKFG